MNPQQTSGSGGKPGSPGSQGTKEAGRKDGSDSGSPKHSSNSDDKVDVLIKRIEKLEKQNEDAQRKIGQQADEIGELRKSNVQTQDVKEFASQIHEKIFLSDEPADAMNALYGFVNNIVAQAQKGEIAGIKAHQTLASSEPRYKGVTWEGLKAYCVMNDIPVETLQNERMQRTILERMHRDTYDVETEVQRRVTEALEAEKSKAHPANAGTKTLDPNIEGDRQSEAIRRYREGDMTALDEIDFNNFTPQPVANP